MSLRLLGLHILHVAIFDLLHGQSFACRRDAELFFFGEDAEPNLRLWCDLADVDPQELREAAKRRMAHRAPLPVRGARGRPRLADGDSPGSEA